MTAMKKRELRAELRSRFAGADVREKESCSLCQHILHSPWYEEARVVAGYMPMSREADITPVLAEVLCQGKILALPLCGKPPHMTMRRVESLEKLHTGAYGILEPSEDWPIVPMQEIDLLLVPLEGIDTCGWRLGKGGGYYDRLLADTDVLTMGCVLSWQWTDKIPHDVWDRKLHACADRNGIHLF